MKKLRYLKNVSTLVLNTDACIGCGMCVDVCPHAVFDVSGQKARITDRDGCMECGACALNCPVDAIRVTPGVGCAAHIIQTRIRSGNLGVCGPGGACC